MKKLKDFLLSLASPKPAPPSLAPDPEPPQPTSLLSPSKTNPEVALRGRIDRVYSFRGQISTLYDQDPYQKPSIFQHLPQLKERWDQLLAYCLDKRSKSEEAGASLRLKERLEFFTALCEGLSALPDMNNHIPHSLVQVLLLTLQELLEHLRTSQAFRLSNPSKATDVAEFTRSLWREMVPLLILVEYCVCKDSSTLLLSKDTTEVVTGLLATLVSKLQGISPGVEDPSDLLDPAVDICHHSIRCVYALGELHRTHIPGNSQSPDLLNLLTKALFDCLASLYHSADWRKTGERQYPVSCSVTSHILEKLGMQYEKCDLGLRLLWGLYRLGKQNPLLSSFMGFLADKPLESVLIQLKSIRSGSQLDLAIPREKLLLLLKLLSEISNLAPDSVRLDLFNEKGKYRDIVQVLGWIWLETGETVSGSLTRGRGVLETGLRKLLNVCTKALVGSEAEALPVGFFVAYLETDMAQGIQDRVPVLQAYTLEFLVLYLNRTTMERRNYAALVKSDLLYLLFSPLFFTIPNDYESGLARDLASTANEHLNALFKYLIERKKGKKHLVRQLVKCVELNKANPTYVQRLISLVSGLLAESDEQLVQCLQRASLGDIVFGLLRDTSKETQIPRESVDSLKVLMIKLLDVPEIAAQVQSKGEISQRLMGHFLFDPEFTEFAIECMSKLLRQDSADSLYSLYVAALRQAESLELLQTLLQGVERTLRVEQSKARKCQAAFVRHKILPVLLEKMKTVGDLGFCSLILPTFRVLLQGNEYCKAQMTELGFIAMRQLLFDLYSTRRKEPKFVRYLETLFDNLFFLLLETTSLTDARRRQICLPEMLPLVTSLLIDLCPEHLAATYMGVLRACAEEAVENGTMLAQRDCTQLLLKYLPETFTAELRGTVTALIVEMLQRHAYPRDILSVLRLIQKELQRKQAGSVALNTLLQVLRCSHEASILTLRNALTNTVLRDVAPASVFRLSAPDARFTVSQTKARLALFPKYMPFTLLLWVRPELNPHFPLQSLLTLAANGTEYSGHLYLTAAGSLRFLILDEDKVVYEALTEVDKMAYNHWNFVTLSYTHEKKRSLQLSLNGKICLLEAEGKPKLPSKLLAEVTIGSTGDSEQFKGEVRSLALIHFACSQGHIQALLKLGVAKDTPYEDSPRITDVGEKVLLKEVTQALIYRITPLVSDAETVGALLRASEPPFDSPGQLLAAASQDQELHLKGVTRLVTSKVWDCLRVLGGPMLLLPYMSQLPPGDEGVAALNDFLRVIADFCAIPDAMTYYAVMKGLLAEMLSLVLASLVDRIHFDENIISSLILLVDSLDWSKDCKGKMFEKLLLSFSLWHKLQWSLQRMVSVNIVKFLATIYQETKGRHLALKQALDMLSMYYSLSKTTAEKRYEFVELIKNQLIAMRPLGDLEIKELVSAVAGTLKSHPKDLVDLLKLLTYLESNQLVQVSAATRTDVNTLLLHLLRRCGKAKLTMIQSLALEAIKIAYIDKAILPSIAESTDSSICAFPSAPLLLATLNSCLGDSLNNDLYEALLGLLLVPGATMHIRHPEVLDLICSRLTLCDCLDMIVHELTYLARFQTQLLYERITFPAWTLSLFTAYKPQLLQDGDARAGMLVDLTIIVLTNVLQTIDHAVGKLRAFFLSLLHEDQSQEWTERVAFRVLMDLLDSLIRVLPDPTVTQAVLHNIHELYDVIEDMLTARPALTLLPSFPDLVSKLLKLATQLKLAHSSYPPLPDLPMQTVNRLYRETPPQPTVDWSVTRLREGGLLRTLLKLVLVAMQRCDSGRLGQLVEMLCVLVTGDRGKKQLFSGLAASYKAYCENKLREAEPKDRYPFLFSSFPRVVSNDLLYSEEFLVVLLFTELTELVLDRRQNSLSYEPLLSLMKELVKFYKLGHYLNQLLTTETSDTLSEFTSFVHDFLLDTSSIARQLHRDFSLYQDTAVALAEDLPAFTAKSLKLMMNLNLACGGTLESILNIVKSKEWLETVQLYLLVKTSMKMQVVERAVSFYPAAPVVAMAVLRPEGSISALVSDAVKQLKARFVTEREEKSRFRHQNDAHEVAFHKCKWKKLVKSTLELSDFLESDDPSSLYQKLEFVADAEMRHCNLRCNKQGSPHEEAINKKYRRHHGSVEDAPTPRRRMTVQVTALSSQTEELRRQLLKQLPRRKSGRDWDSPPNTRRVSLAIESEASDEDESVSGPSPEPADSCDIPEIVPNPSPEGSEDREEEIAAGTLKVDCERISVRGSYFGSLEVTKRFIIFRTGGEKKPVGKYFGSALGWTQILKAKEQVWELSELTEVFSRRFLHRHTALEVYFRSGRSYFFNCFTNEARTSLMQFLKDTTGSGTKIRIDPGRDVVTEKVSSAWKHGKMSNFEYLMLLNRYASRSFNDLNQYPVFPWVLTNYSSPTLDLSDPGNYRNLSLPVGAIDPDSREDCVNRYEHWVNDDVMKPFHYGSHYSTGGIVLHYLLRLEPFTAQAIALQDGQFDVADRLFSAIDIAWNGSLKNTGDYKELIPEFFYLPEFLLNLNGYMLGQSQTLEPVDHVTLPPWAKNVYDFIHVHKAALESAYVSEHLHEWIDLIFGCKQSGEEAVSAINVFFSITYEQNVRHLFEDQQSDGSLEGIIEQIAHYGQTPVQLFKKEHPKRLVKPRQSTLFEDLKRQEEGLETALLWSFAEENEAVVGIFCLKSRLVLATNTRRVKLVKWKTSENLRLELSYGKDQDLALAGVLHSPQPLTSLCYCATPDLIISGLYCDNSFKVHSLTDGSLKASVSHHINMVCCFSLCGSHLIAGSLDSTLSLWTLQSNKEAVEVSLVFGMTGQMSGIKQCCAHGDMQICVSLALDGAIAVHSLLSGLYIKRVKPTGSPVACIALSCDGLIGYFRPGSEQITVISRNAGNVANIPIPKLDEVTYFAFTNDGSELLCAGTQSLLVAQVFGEKGKQVKRCLQDYPVTAIATIPGEQHLLISLQNRTVCKVELRRK